MTAFTGLSSGVKQGKLFLSKRNSGGDNSLKSGPQQQYETATAKEAATPFQSHETELSVILRRRLERVEKSMGGLNSIVKEFATHTDKELSNYVKTMQTLTKNLSIV